MFRRLAVSLALVIAATACTAAGETTTTEGGAPTTGPTETTAADPTTTTTLPPTTTTRPDLSGLEGLSEETQAQLADLIVVAQGIRGLTFATPPTIVVVSSEELEQRLASQFEEDVEDFPGDEALYKLLGLLDPSADLEALLTEVYSQSAGGFYDLEEKEIVVPAREDGFSLLQQSTLIHELVHALTDQNFGVHEPFKAMADDERYDEASAYLALIEGDASLAEFLWLQTLSRQQLGELLAETLTIDTTALDAAPPFIRDALIFPYDSGLAFVQDLYESGGWSAVNDAYGDFPAIPPSTEQVITPDDYGRDLPIPVELPEIVIEGYELATESTWGESGFRIMIDQVLGPGTALAAADGWGGDTYYQWFDGENAAFLIGYVGDTQADLAELEDALVDYAFTAVAEEDFVWVEEVAGILYFIAADDPTVGVLIRSAVGAG